MFGVHVKRDVVDVVVWSGLVLRRTALKPLPTDREKSTQHTPHLLESPKYYLCFALQCSTGCSRDKALVSP